MATGLARGCGLEHSSDGVADAPCPVLPLKAALRWTVVTGARLTDSERRSAAVAEPIITASGLHKSFGETHALRGIDLTVERGEVLAVMGPSGSGKSTLIHCMAGVLTPDAGTVTLDGVELTALGADARARLRLERIGFVFQFGQLLPDLTAVDNVALPLLMNRVSRKEANASALEQLELLGLVDQARKVPGGCASLLRPRRPTRWTLSPRTTGSRLSRLRRTRLGHYRRPRCLAAPYLPRLDRSPT